ncbi:hypothetical protein AX17_001107 [Amanita inopinata Kibby_2008]|nr:hypothetical protein AX17_001107 [Amanita inopinata Kibby_2008]
MSDSLIHSVAGAAGGIVAMTATYPLIFLSTRAAVETKNEKKSVRQAVLDIIKREGVAGLYSGLSSSLFGIAVTNGVYYYFYERSREVILNARKGGKALSTAESMLTGLIAGSATTVISNPIWVVQTSQAVRTLSSDGHESKPIAKKLGFFETVQNILTKDGIGAFWRGIGPALILVINPVLQYTVFEQLKNLLISRRTRKLRAAGAATAVAILSDWDFLILGAISKLVATSLTYPYIVVKSRLQAGSANALKYKSSLDGLLTILKGEGIEGLYKGIGSKLIQSVLTAAILFAGQRRIYEVTKNNRYSVGRLLTQNLKWKKNDVRPAWLEQATSRWQPLQSRALPTELRLDFGMLSHIIIGNMTSAVSAILACGKSLIASGSSSDLRATLSSRLSHYYELRGFECRDFRGSSAEELQQLTAREALSVVCDVQKVLIQQEAQPDVAVGTHDLAQIRTLLSVALKWGIEPLLSACLKAWPSKAAAGFTRVDATTIIEQYALLADLTIDLMGLLFPAGFNDPLANTHITATMINHHLADILKPCLALGWLPKTLVTESVSTVDSLRPITLRLLSTLSPSQAIHSLGRVLSSTQAPSLHMHRICIKLLGKQVSRQDGVKGLCEAVFGEEEVTGDEAPLEKLQHVARVLIAVPPGMEPKDYYSPVVHQLLTILSASVPSLYKRAAAFVVSRMLTTEQLDANLDFCAGLLLTSLHRPFLQLEGSNTAAGGPELQVISGLSLPMALSMLIPLVANMDPLPELLSRLLSPITPVLYSLLYYLESVKTSDPSLRESVRGLLITWGKIVDRAEGITYIWNIHQVDPILWDVDSDGNVQGGREFRSLPTLALFTPGSLQQAQESGSLDDDANVLNLYPDPAHYVRFMKALDRSDIASDLFVKFLESYREQRLSTDAEPVRTLLTLQITMQMQKQLSTGPSSSNLLCKPTHMLLFIKHVLETSLMESQSHVTNQRQDIEGGLGRSIDVLVVPRRTQSIEEEEVDSDDDTPDIDVAPKDEMMETAINLLLSILEANEDLSARTTPILNDIFSLLEPVARDGFINIRSLAREAKMVMTARLASTSTSRKPPLTEEEESSQDIYQKALKLLQDPILPVRAHGLLLLRQLIYRSKLHNGVNPALIPAILSIFLQSVEDDESYLFLNAVQGLATMVDKYGKDVLKTLIKEYTDGLLGVGTIDMSQHDVDVRLRVGEALGIVIQRCGVTLSNYADLLIPPLFKIVRSGYIPTTLRTSALSLLAHFLNTYTLAILPYIVDLSEVMVDLLQVEGVSTKNTPREPHKSADSSVNGGIEVPTPTMDSQPTSVNSKFPPLRRAALHFLSLLIRSMTQELYEKSASLHVPGSLLRRAKTTLAYVSFTDEDAVVRVMAREAGDSLQQLQQAILGLSE